MEKLIKKVIKEVSNKDINVKKNYKAIRALQEIINPSFLYSKNYEDVLFDLKDREIKGRVFKNFKDNKKLKIIIFIHGGGWATGSIDSYTKTCMDLSNKTGRVVISIDYRLAPEYPYPAGFNDCYEVVKLIMDNLAKFELTEEDVCLMGDSAGGNLIAAISLRSIKEKTFRVRDQILLYPALQNDYSNNTKYKSVIEKGQDYFLTQKQLQDYMSLYITDVKQLQSPYVSPLNKKLLFFQPRTLLITSDNDPLRDEGKTYARKLRLCLNYVKYYNLEDAMHGFFNNPLDKKYKEETYKRIKQFLGDSNE